MTHRLNLATLARAGGVAVCVCAALAVAGATLTPPRAVPDCPPAGGSLRPCVLFVVHIWDALWWTDAARALAISTAVSLLLSVTLAVIVARALRSPGGSLVVGVLGAAIAITVAAVAVVMPLAHHVPHQVLPAIAIDYFLAMTNWFFPASPYPFMWSARWEFDVGVSIALIPLGASMALSGGLVGLRRHRVGAMVIMGVGAVLLAAYAVDGWLATAETWVGVPV